MKRPFPELFVVVFVKLLRVLRVLLRAEDARRQTPAPAAGRPERAQAEHGGGDAVLELGGFDEHLGPGSALRSGEEAMAARLGEAMEDLNCINVI